MVATSKLSQIAMSPANPVSGDTFVGVHTANTDYQFTFAQLAAAFSASITINTTPVTGGLGNNLLYDNAGVVSEVTIGGNLTFSGGTLSATNEITINVTGIVSGVSGRVLYDNAGFVGEAANFNIIAGQPNVPSMVSYLCDGLNAVFVVPSASGNNWFESGAGTAAGGFTGFQNFGTGDSALSALTSGSQNTAVGAGVLQSLTIGGGNVGMGTQALFRLVSGDQNFALGKFNLSNITNEGGHVAVGGGVLASLTGSVGGGSGAGQNVGVGSLALANDISGGANVAVGAAGPLGSVTTGSFNTAVGYQSLSFGNCSNCIGVGYLAGNGTNTNSIFIGNICGFHTHGDNNVWIGFYDDFTPRSNTFVLNFGPSINTLRIDYGITAAGWTFADLATAGLMTTNASGTLAIANSAPAATIPANFSATNRIQVNIGGTTFFIPADSASW